MITQARLKELLHYDPETGIFTRIKSYCSKAKIGNIAGVLKKDGYLRIGVDGRHLAHRLAFVYMTGEFSKVTDHINGNRSDNRWENLRSVTNNENLKNQKMRSTNTSGVMGVYWSKVSKKWAASIRSNGGKFHLGVFDDINDAYAARRAAEKKYNFHPNHGRAAEEPVPAPSVNVQGNMFSKDAR